MHDAESLARMLARSSRAVALTGAGISTESGIPDFRSADGVWQEHDPMEVSSMSTFMAEPERFWQFHRPRIDLLSDVEPNAGHRAITELQRRGALTTLITQNIDRLHVKAGSSDVVEVHGSLSGGTCLRCHGDVSLEELVRRADAATDGVPRCEPCGFQMKSRVIMFGEPLPADAIGAAFDAAENADAMLVVGSSLAVAPVSQLPQAVLDNGGTLAILTEGDTPYDDLAHIRLRGSAGDELVAVLDHLDATA